ncbi:MAG: OmpA family protein, partial [Saprospiraceae bacterium]|nr:OmpA family protein [Saprospiraceae bacterium]
KAHLKAISYETLDKIVDLLKKYPEFELEIVGHTDDVGRKQSNLELSLDRATSCKDYLISRKIDAMRIKVLAEGELKPLDSNRTETGRELNRRVEFIVIGQ